MNVYSIYDLKAKIYSTPFFRVNDAVAERDFSALAKDESTSIGRNPEDYVLCRLGQWDDQTGVLVPEAISQLNSASQFSISEDK